MIEDGMHSFMEFLMRFFSFKTSIQIKESITLLAGFTIGVVTLLIFLCSILAKANIEWRKFDKEDKILVVRFIKKDYQVTYVNPPKSFFSVLNTLLALITLKFDKNNSVSLKDLRKFKVIITVLFIIGLLSILIAASFIIFPEIPPHVK